MTVLAQVLSGLALFADFEDFVARNIGHAQLARGGDSPVAMTPWIVASIVVVVIAVCAIVVHPGFRRFTGGYAVVMVVLSVGFEMNVAAFVLLYAIVLVMWAPVAFVHWLVTRE